MESGSVWVGIDVGESRTSICFLPGSGECRVAEVTGSSTREIAAELDLVERSTIVAIALESSAGHRLPRELAERGFPIVTIDPARARKFLSIRSIKTDANDARGLAEIAKLGATSRVAVHVKNLTCERVRFQIVLRDQLVRQKNALRNALRSHLRTFGSEFKTLPPATKLREHVEVDLQRLREEGYEDAVADLSALLEVTEALTQYVARMDRRMQALAENLGVTKRFMEIPGVGPISALSFYCAIEDPHRFARSRDVGAYLGMTPALKQSGSMTRNGRITKAGNKLTRSHLVMSASVILGHATGSFALGDWGRDLRARIGWGKARVALARKLAILMLAIWKTGQRFEAHPETRSTP